MLRTMLALAAGLLIAASAIAQPRATPALEQLQRRADAGESLRLVVGVELGSAFVPEGNLPPQAQAAQRQRIAAAQERVATLLTSLGGRDLGRFQFVPFMVAQADSRALRGLLNSPLVTAIEEDEATPHTLFQSVPLIGTTAAWNAGLTGAGWAVAVLDTGVDKNHPFLVNTVVSEACYSTSGGTPGTSGYSVSLCPGGVSSSTATDSALPCASNCAHGTHVAGIAVGGPRTSDGSYGVARDGSVIAIQVFSLFPDYNGPGQAAVLSYNSDQIRGLERVYALRSTFNIASANMSLGGGRYYANCDVEQSSRKTIIDNLRSVGIATVISAGNNGYRDSMGAPACISTAVSVAATCDAADGGTCLTGVNGIASYSNVASFVSLAAPGSFIVSSVPGTSYQNYSGTSMSAPHVAGAWALLKQQNPALSVTDALAALRNNATTINDTRSSGTVTGIKLVNLNFLGTPSSNFSLSVSKSGTGSGTVTSSPAGINCGSTCSASFASGTVVALTALAGAGSSFANWTGACSGNGACSVSLGANTTVGAVFNALPQTVALGAASYTVGEGAGSVSIPVTRSSGAGTASVSYATANGTATAGQDYTAASGTLSFAAGVTTQNIVVSITNDTAIESNEDFSVTLSNPSAGLSLGAPSAATVTIVDNDSTIAFEAAAVSVAENAGTVTLWITRTGNASAAASVRFATSNGSARQKQDYINTSGTVSWAAGDTSRKAITVQIVNDTQRENAETFNVTLSNVSGATLVAPSAATVTIVDND